MVSRSNSEYEHLKNSIKSIPKKIELRMKLFCDSNTKSKFYSRSFIVVNVE